MFKRTLTALAAGALLAAGAGDEAKARELSFATFIPAASTTVRELYEPWIEWFNERAAAEGVSIRLFAGGTLGRNPLAQADMVRDGVADITITVPSYTPGVYPDFDVVELPGYIRSVAEGAHVINELYREGALRGYEDFHVVSIFTPGQYLLHTRTPIGSVADISGKRIRVGGQIQGQIIEALGGVPVTMGAGEMAENIDRRLIDGAAVDASVARSFRVADVATHHFAAPLGTLVFAIVMNRDVYESMPDSVKALLAESNDFLMERQIQSYGGFIDATMEMWEASADHTVVHPSEADLNAISDAVAGIVEQVRGAAAPGVYDAFVAKIEDVRNR